MKKRDSTLSVVLWNGFLSLVGVALMTAGSAGSALAAGPVIQRLTSVGLANLQSLGGEGSDAVQAPEFGPEVSEGDVAGFAGSTISGGRLVNRSIAKAVGKGAAKAGTRKAKSNPEILTSFDGVNFRQQRLANGGNQFSVEPPDQALCVGNGYVLEAVNTVLRIFDTSGSAATGVIDLNTFYGYPAAINRTTRVFGPSITDPVCHFDVDTQRWFLVVLTLDSRPDGVLTGKNHLDIAVSQSASPLGSWKIFRLPAQNDGTDGTPNHGCFRGDPAQPGPCLGDYPHIGADKYGIYLTTNEFCFFGPGCFTGAQIYALSKAALTASDNRPVPVVLLDSTEYLFEGLPGFTVWPAISTGNEFDSTLGGTEYFLSSTAVFAEDGTSDRIRVWALSNTASIDDATPSLLLQSGKVMVDTYAVPDRSNQKPGSIPLAECINSGATCRAMVGADYFGPEVLSKVDSNDSRMQQVAFANGKLWGALDTAVEVDGRQLAGIAYYVLVPQITDQGVKANLKQQGVVAMANNHVIYPAIAVLRSGRGVMAFTLVGDDYFPSAAYTSLDDKSGAGEIHVAAPGLGPQDGFSGYKAFGNPPDPRWGDYGAAASDGTTLWFASEYVGQTCTFAEYVSTPFGSCGGTRAALGNWGTRITRVQP